MVRFWLALTIAGLAALPQAIHAQPRAGAQPPALSADVLTDPDRLVEVAREESSRGNHAAALSFYVRAISRRPNDPRILTAAGEEALAIGDNDAAFGFLGRAATLNPRDPRARAGYARALVQADRPKDALTLFDQSVRLGMDESEIAGDRGLARDLLGENRRAQRDYRLGLAADPGDAVLIQRLGLSLAISGDRSGALALVQPLARKAPSGNVNRTLAFIHALSGDIAAARKVAMANMTVAQADAFIPFFARIALLDDEAKAAAVHLGHLPPVRMALKDKGPPKRVKALDGEASAIRSAAAGDAPPAPAKAPDRQPELPDKKAAAKEPAATSDALVLDAECAKLSGKRKTRCEADARALARRCDRAKSKPTAECKAYAVRLADLNAAPAKAKPDRDEAVVAKAAAPADACADLSGRRQTQCRADARALEKRCGGASPRKTAECKAYAARRENASADESAAPAKSPRRFWVQVASGSNRKDLPRAWGRLKAKSPALLGKQVPHFAAFGATNRLLVGPFDSTSDARDLVNRLNAAGLSSFPWTSADGENVDRLAVK